MLYLLCEEDECQRYVQSVLAASVCEVAAARGSSMTAVSIGGGGGHFRVGAADS
jgi:hypothetical protein